MLGYLKSKKLVYTRDCVYVPGIVTGTSDALERLGNPSKDGTMM
jgi:hypothetical protein